MSLFKRTIDKAIRKTKAQDTTRVITQKNGYRLAITEQGHGERIILMFPGETESNPHMWLGDPSSSNITKAKQLFAEFANMKSKVGDAGSYYTVTLENGKKHERVPATSGKQAIEKVAALEARKGNGDFTHIKLSAKATKDKKAKDSNPNIVMGQLKNCKAQFGRLEKAVANGDYSYARDYAISLENMLDVLIERMK